MATPLGLTGERTAPGVPTENYWFRRHEAVYAAVPGLAAASPSVTARSGSRPAVVLDAGSGEGYGAALLAGALPGFAAVGVDYDAVASTHATRAHGGPHTAYLRGLVTALPLAGGSADVVVSLQVIEHIWNPDGYVRELARVCRAGGTVVLSTPNRLTFSPGLGPREQPANIFHCREYDAEELAEAVPRWAPSLEPSQLLGLRHGPRLRDWEAEHGPVVGAQLASVPEQWPEDVAELVASVVATDFELTAHALQDSLDLVAVLQKSG